MKIVNLPKKGDLHDSYGVAFCNWNDHPVIKLSEEVSLYRIKHWEDLLEVVNKLALIDDDDHLDFVDRLDSQRMRVSLVYKISSSKTYMRIHHASTNSLHK